MAETTRVTVEGQLAMPPAIAVCRHARSTQLAFSIAFTDKNAIAGFTCTGISPFDRSIFTEVDYAPSSVTDRLLLDNNEIQPSAIEDDRTIGTDGLPEPGPRDKLNDHSSRPNNSELPALRAIQPRPISYTPEKNAIEVEYNQRNKAKKTIFQPHTGKGKRTLLTAEGKGKGKGKKTKNPPGSKGKENQSEACSNSSDDEDYYCLVC
ncbi:hypothetical protein JTB14_033960 [Gonioctena quinquepunctata]|nr:hypothetical protein JTB14_033960 [Gonioctena quinquepunctata]